jgi:alkyl hydroperoxide reductase subunit AhpC
LRAEYQSFQDAGTEVVALAVAPLSAVNDGVRRVIEPPYPVLADPDHEVAEAYGVYNLLGDGYAAPSVFIVDSNRDIVWSHVGQSPSDRPQTSTILENLP